MTESNRPSSIREQLDAVRPDSDDLSDEALRQAAEAVQSSRAWRRVFDDQQEIDRRIAVAMHDVAVPAGVLDRLRDVLASAAPAEVVTNTAAVEAAGEAPSTSTSRWSRRDWTRLAIAFAATVSCLAAGFLFLSGGEAPLTLDALRNGIPLAADGQIALDGLTPFDESFPLEEPAGDWGRVEFDAALGLDWTDDGRHDAAILPFVAGGREPLRGYLLIVPAAGVADPPSRTYLSAADVNYVPLENSACTNAAGDLVFVCFTSPGRLDDLVRLLYPQSA